MFEGFSPEAIDFLWGIRMNNNRDWFLAHKDDYVTYLYEPMKALGQYLFEPFQEVPGLLLKVSRIYRDARLHHPDPYKESLWICIRREVDSWSEHPALFFEIRPEGVSYGFTLWRPRPASMEAFRRDLEDRPTRFTKLLAETQAAAGLPITASQYHRKKPCPMPEIEPWYSWKGNICCVAEEPVGDSIFTPGLAVRSQKLLKALLPWNEYWQSVIG